MASLNVYEMVTERIIKQLEQGTIPWQKPWGGVRSGAFNRISKRPYSLKNQLLLEHPGEYCSFQQWKSLGGHIKKGAKSLRKESKVVQTKKQYGDFSLTALSFASISIFSG